jgi:hypothetical protein
MESPGRKPDVDYKVMQSDKLRKIDTYGNVVAKFDENFDYHLVNSDGSEYQISRDEFLEIGSTSAMNPSDISIDIENKKVVVNYSDYFKK